MARKKKNGSQEKTTKSLLLATAILNLIIKLIELLEKLLDRLLD